MVVLWVGLDALPAQEAARRQPHLIVHRQALEAAPENTWAALKQAVLWGADRTVTLEVDLAVTKDGKIFLFHDDWFDWKNEEVQGRANDFVWEEINDVDFGWWYHPQFKGERLPLFEDVVKFCKQNGVRLVLDHLNPAPPKPDRASSEMVLQILDKHGARDVVYFQMGGSVPIGREVGPATWMAAFDGDRETLRQALKQKEWGTIWVDDPRVLLDGLHRDVPKREVKMPAFSRDYRAEELDFNALVRQVRTGGDAGRIAAARLRKHFKARAGAALTAILAGNQTSAEVKTIAARALGRLSESRAVTVTERAKAKAALNTALTHPDAEVRAAAAYALGKLKDEQAVAPLTEMLRNLQETDKVRVEAARALGRIGSARAVPLLAEVAREEREEATNVIFPNWAKIWQEKGYWTVPWVLLNCYWALGEIGGEEALDFLLAQYRQVTFPAEKDRSLFLTEAVVVRQHALEAAARIGGAKALAAVKAATWEPPLDTYFDFVRLTRNFAPKAIVPVLLEFLGHPKTYQRCQAFYALLRVGEPAVKPLIGLLNNQQASPVAREWAAWTLGWMNDRRAVAPLMNALNDNVPGVRAKAAWAMGRMRVKQSANRLKELTKDTDAAVRDYAAEALERLGIPSAAATPPQAQFLTRRGNQLFFGGKRFRAVGASCVDAFVVYCGMTHDERTPQWAEEAVAEAGRRDIPFLRTFGSGFWPKDMKIYFDDPATYWKRFDEFVALAKKNNVKLLPTLFWNYQMWPDLMKEPCSKIFERGSRTRQAMEKYLRELVGRYRDDPTILCWEIGNEMNLGADLNKMHWPQSGIAPQMGTPSKRTTADSFTTADLVRFTKEMAALIKNIDRNHLVTTGHALPRFSSRALREGFPEVRWRSLDTIEDFLASVEMLHPDPVDIVSIHIYDGTVADAERASWEPGKDWIGLLRQVKARCDKMGKPLFIGEFCDNQKPDDPSAPFSTQLMARMVEWDIPLAAYWVWYRPQDPDNIAQGVKEPLIEKIRQTNQALGTPYRKGEDRG